MKNNELYEYLMDGKTKLPSVMGIVPHTEYIFTFENILYNLKNSQLFDVKNVRITQEKLNCDILIQNKNFKVEFHIYNLKELDLEIMKLGNKLGADELSCLKNKTQYIESKMYFDNDSLVSYHIQLKILDAIVPNKGLLLDISSLKLLSGEWLKLVANSDICPSPTYLYSVHVVYDEYDEETKYWLHTHGLHRCGCVEIEIVEIEFEPDEYISIINTIAKRFIENGMIRTEKVVDVGDGMDFVWVPWEKGLKKIKQELKIEEIIVGGKEDRQDGLHDRPSGILFAVKDKQFTHPSIYHGLLQDNPVFYVTTSETDRMSSLAKERFEHFRNILSFYKHIKGWRFLIKLGIIVDSYEDINQKEHLWFNVESIYDDKVDAVLLNKPYWVSKMKEEDRVIYDLDTMTDWIIYSPTEEFTPDSIYRFYQMENEIH
ncbi:DUF4026 domain-containing protein [Clostridiaceae bacterium M8S5]|nr:DUF4026 domain-containing protein [Clostridiaceae bacterium M8S5]